MEKHSCKTYFVFRGARSISELLSAAKKELSEEFYLDGDGVATGKNDDYDVDVNVMIRKTLQGLFGKEDKIGEIAKRYDCVAYLEIVPYIVANSDSPNQYLSLERDVIEFLYRSGASVDLDYYVV